VQPAAVLPRKVQVCKDVLGILEEFGGVRKRSASIVDTSWNLAIAEA
jgi:hypothetical protein